jgi:hypothetical protein
LRDGDPDHGVARFNGTTLSLFSPVTKSLQADITGRRRSNMLVRL